MITTLPAVQAHVSHAPRVIVINHGGVSKLKRKANRLHRRYLNQVTRRLQRDSERWDDEPFHAPSLSTWDLW